MENIEQNQQCDAFLTQQTLERKKVLVRVLRELDKAEAQHPEWPKDHIHQAAIVQEEAGELIRATLQLRYEKGHTSSMIKEATQTTAMGLRFLLNNQVPAFTLGNLGDMARNIDLHFESVFGKGIHIVDLRNKNNEDLTKLLCDLIDAAFSAQMSKGGQ